MSRISLESILGECSVSIPKIANNLTSSTVSGYVRIGAIPANAKSFDAILIRSGSSYVTPGGKGFDTYSRLDVPSPGAATAGIWIISDNNLNLYYATTSAPSTVNIVKNWVFQNNNGYLDACTHSTSSQDPLKIFLNLVPQAPMYALIKVKFYG